MANHGAAAAGATLLQDARVEPLSFVDARRLCHLYAIDALARPTSPHALMGQVLDAGYWSEVASDGEAVAAYLASQAPLDREAVLHGLVATSGALSVEAMYNRALDAFRRGDGPVARCGFAICHAAGVDVRAGAVLSLAICALVDRADAIAADLTDELIEAGETHPRIFLASGLASARRGRLGEAKKAWARAARAARGSPHLRADLHAAQRILLGLQFGILPTDVDTTR
ncbi:MAG: hypothetical protein AAF318_01335 [Pseudomonadota bacterium]